MNQHNTQTKLETFVIKISYNFLILMIPHRIVVVRETRNNDINRTHLMSYYIMTDNTIVDNYSCRGKKYIYFLRRKMIIVPAK